MAEWSDLDNELNIWRDSGHEATFWWRDDDAIELTDQLSRLLAIVVKHQAPRKSVV